jgi:hypothetical protein
MLLFNFVQINHQSQKALESLLKKKVRQKRQRSTQQISSQKNLPSPNPNPTVQDTLPPPTHSSPLLSTTTSPQISNLHTTPTPPARFFNPKPKNKPIQIPHPHPLLVPPQPLHALRRLTGSQPFHRKRVRRTHAFVVYD